MIRSLVVAVLMVIAVGAKAADESAPIQVLLVTGYNHPAHPWRDTTLALQDVLKADPRFNIRVVEDPAFLESPALSSYDVILLNFADFERPSPGDKARANLAQAIDSGKGLFVLHFASGAFDESPDFVKQVGRIWKNGTSGHDVRGPFRVEVIKTENPITKGLESFDTDDELYYSLDGDRPIEVLATARSKITGKDEPMAFLFTQGQGRVFHTTLGHDAKAIQVPGTAELVRRGLAWAAGRDPLPPKPEVKPAEAKPADAKASEAKATS